MFDFKDKDILVAGRGISGLGAKEALTKLGARVWSFCDPDEFEPRSYDMIVLSPSFEKGHFLYAYAHERGVPVIGEYALGVMINDKPFVAVTGTNGKTTVVNMIKSMSSFRKAALCGNVGASFALTAANGGYDYAITEVSSFQLEQTPFLKPKIAIITNITPDHLIRHKTMEEYCRLKYKVAAFQDENDYLILPYEAPLFGLSMLKGRGETLFVSTTGKVRGGYVEDGFLTFCGERLFPVAKLPVKGDHNVADFLFAVSACKLLGLKNEEICFGIEEFRPADHRIEEIAVIDGVKFVDDSKSTNADSTVKALCCMEGSVCLIMGGSEKNLTYDEIFECTERVIKINLIGEIAPKLKAAALKHGFKNVEIFPTLESAVVDAFLLRPECVLLSPATASYDMFRSYEERGKEFKRVVDEIAHGAY